MAESANTSGPASGAPSRKPSKRLLLILASALLSVCGVLHFTGFNPLDPRFGREAGDSPGVERQKPAGPESDSLQGQFVELLGRMKTWDVQTPSNDYTALHYVNIFEDQLAIANRYIGGLEGKRVFETGPGRSLANGALLAIAGAERYDAVEVFEDPGREDPLPYQVAIMILDALDFRSVRRNPATVFSVKNGKAVLNENLVHLQILPPDNYVLDVPDGSIDLAYSTAVFEHVGDPGCAFRPIVITRIGAS